MGQPKEMYLTDAESVQCELPAMDYNNVGSQFERTAGHRWPISGNRQR